MDNNRDRDNKSGAESEKHNHQSKREDLKSSVAEDQQDVPTTITKATNTTTPPSPKPKPAAQKMIGGKYSKLTRDVVLAATGRRRSTQRQSKVNEILDQVNSADRENVMEFAIAEAEFLKKKRFDEMRLQYKRNMWENEIGDEREAAAVRKPALPVTTESKQNDADGIWILAQTVDGTETKQEWDVDPQAAEKWGVVEHNWNTSSATQDTEASQEQVDGPKSELLGLDNNEEPMPWDEEYSSDEDEAQEALDFRPEAPVDGQQDAYEFSLPQWVAFASEPEVSAKKRTENPAEDDKEDYPGARDDDGDDDDDGDEAFFSWPDFDTVRPNDKKGANQNRITSKPDESKPSSLLPTPPPSPISSPPPEKFELPFEQAWKRIGRILADVHFEERLSAWAAGTKALEHRLRSQGHDCSVHLTNRSPEVRDAETVGLLRRNQDNWRAFNVVTPKKKRDEAAATGSPRLEALAECPCRGPREENALRCPFNRRQRQRHSSTSRECACGVAGCELRRCSRLRQGFTMRELLAEEAAEEDSEMGMS